MVIFWITAYGKAFEPFIAGKKPVISHFKSRSLHSAKKENPALLSQVLGKKY
jgi:hypothetical protein